MNRFTYSLTFTSMLKHCIETLSETSNSHGQLVHFSEHSPSLLLLRADMSWQRFFSKHLLSPCPCPEQCTFCQITSGWQSYSSCWLAGPCTRARWAPASAHQMGDHLSGGMVERPLGFSFFTIRLKLPSKTSIRVHLVSREAEIYAQHYTLFHASPFIAGWAAATGHCQCC